MLPVELPTKGELVPKPKINKNLNMKEPKVDKELGNFYRKHLPGEHLYMMK